MNDSTEQQDLVLKPDEADDRKTSLSRTLLSLALFIGVYYALFQSWVAVISLVTVILIHESGHFIAMKFFGYQSVNMTFVPFVGAYVSGKATNLSKKNKLITLLAGPVPGIIIGCILLYISRQNGSDVLRIAALSFLGLNLFNLLPLFPLDGGQVLQTLFFHGSKTIQLLFLYISLAAMLYFFYRFNYSWIFLLVAALIGLRIAAVNLINRVHRQLDRDGIDYHCSYDDLTDEEYWHIRTVLLSNSSSLAKKYDINDQYGDEQPLVKRIESILMPPYLDDLNTGSKLAFTAIWIIAFAGPIVQVLRWYPVL